MAAASPGIFFTVSGWGLRDPAECLKETETSVKVLLSQRYTLSFCNLQRSYNRLEGMASCFVAPQAYPHASMNLYIRQFTFHFMNRSMNHSLLSTTKHALVVCKDPSQVKALIPKCVHTYVRTAQPIFTTSKRIECLEKQN